MFLFFVSKKEKKKNVASVIDVVVRCLGRSSSRRCKSFFFPSTSAPKEHFHTKANSPNGCPTAI